MDYSLPGFSVHEISQAKILVCCPILFQGTFPTQISKPSLLYLLHWQADSLPLSHVGSPHILMLQDMIFPIADLRYLKDYKSFSFLLFLFSCLFPLLLPFLIPSFLFFYSYADRATVLSFAFQNCFKNEIHVNPWLTHVNVWQKLLQYCKVICLQLIKINEKNNDKNEINLKLVYSTIYDFLFQVNISLSNN